jgi:hypothetical protein
LEGALAVDKPIPLLVPDRSTTFCSAIASVEACKMSIGMRIVFCGLFYDKNLKKTVN